MSFIVITPVKNEEKYFHFIADSMLSQSLLPSEWIVVDDGSDDNTAALILKYTNQYNWIRYVKFDDQGAKRSYGAKVIKAFNFGLRNISFNDYDFITKLDADLTLPKQYFNEINLAFEENTRLGVVGGVIVEKKSDLIEKMKRDEFVEGAVKSIRKKCFEDIGGLWEVNGWDGIDQHLARYRGWEVKNLPIAVKHHRTEAQEYLSLNFYFQNGISSYVLGNNLFLTLIRFIVRIKEKPYLLGSFAFLYGFFFATFTKKRLVDKNFAKFIRKYHYSRIKHRK
jgi:glycosyltransferase involved in cell wall biosynthesis